VIHGGGWKDQRGDARRMMTVVTAAFQAGGWRVVNIGYSPGQRPHKVDPLPMLRDVVAFYDQARRAFPGPICTYGESAGGHLAAMLAIERPSLTCAILNAAPLDLPTLLKHTVPAVVRDLKGAFGTRRSVLHEFSPGLRWNSQIDRTAVFATAASNDQFVPPDQLTAFKAADPSADTQIVPGAAAGSSDALPWMHSAVNRNAIEMRQAELGEWLDRIVPRQEGAAISQGTDTGADCGSGGSPSDRWKLMLAGDAWQQASTAGQPIAATRGCSGSGHWQDDGLSLWTFPEPGAVVPAGTQASLTLQTPTVARRLSVSFRGFLARPQDWVLGLYASSSAQGGTLTKVAACDRGSCSGLRLVSTGAGALIAPRGSSGDPDQREQPPSATFSLPSGTRRLVWLLGCKAPAGCSLSPAVGPTGSSLRPRDPLGQPAIFSIYRAVVR
jgi:dienelactone hydrolase